MLLFIAAVAGTGYVILFAPGFFDMNPYGTDGGALGLGITGMDLMRTFWNSITDFSHEFSFDPATVFMTYAIALYLVVSAILVIVVVLQWLITGFKLKRITRFYTISLWLFIVAILLSGAYGWFAADYISNSQDATFSFSLFPFWAYVPLLVGFVMSILGGVFRQSEGTRR